MSRGRTPAIGRSSNVIATSRAAGCAIARTAAATAAMTMRTGRSLPAGVARRRRPAGAVLAEVLHLVFLDVAIVFVERAREFVRAVVATDEVQIFGVGRVHGGLERGAAGRRSEEHTSELQSRRDLVCRLLLEKKKGESHFTQISSLEQKVASRRKLSRIRHLNRVCRRLSVCRYPGGDRVEHRLGFGIVRVWYS